MRYSSIVVSLLVVFLLPFPAIAGDPLTPRPLDAVAADTFQRAMHGSALVRSLVAAIESSNVIVHIVSTLPLPAGVGGTMTYVTSRGGYRYARIAIRPELSAPMRTAILGHELQHARELADSDADNPAAVEELFEQRGRRTGRFYETRAAVDAEMHVRTELRASRALQAEPVIKFHH
ncbi:MAG TPA: hypothetical protein VF491_04905 [Vicinamibacterales bacterium]|jgi:hypothetical protein